MAYFSDSAEFTVKANAFDFVTDDLRSDLLALEPARLELGEHLVREENDCDRDHAPAVKLIVHQALD